MIRTGPSQKAIHRAARGASRLASATEAARWDDDTDDTDETDETDTASRPSVNSAAADELPIADYDSLPVRGVVIALRGINDDADLTAVEQYERSHKNRAGVLTAVQNRTEALAHDTARG